MSWNTHPSDRRSRLPSNWDTHIVPYIKRRDPWCKHPGCTNRTTDVDHVLRGDDHSPSNLQGLCSFHHRLKTSSEGGLASAAKKRRPTEPPPGTLPRAGS